MKKMSHRFVLALLSALPLGAGSSWAQTAPGGGTAPAANVDQNSSSTDGSEDTPVVVLDPFSVTTEHEGYKATDTLGGGRVRTKLVDTPSAISVITPKFMQDLGITNAQDLFVYTNNTEIAGLGGNFSGVTTRGEGISVSGAAEGDRLKNPAGITR